MRGRAQNICILCKWRARRESCNAQPSGVAQREQYPPEAAGAVRRVRPGSRALFFYVTASALFAYKLNWQTVLFLGYGDERALSLDDRLEPSGREVFFKISYAYQR
jgi:hypothetical protein